MPTFDAKIQCDKQFNLNDCVWRIFACRQCDNAMFFFFCALVWTDKLNAKIGPNLYAKINILIWMNLRLTNFHTPSMFFFCIGPIRQVERKNQNFHANICALCCHNHFNSNEQLLRMFRPVQTFPCWQCIRFFKLSFCDIRLVQEFGTN